MKTIAVKLFAGRGYFVKIGAHVGLAKFAAQLKAFGVSRRVLVVTDRNVGRRYGAGMLGALRQAGFAPRLAVMAAGEKAKNLDTVRRLYGEALKAGLDRRSAVVALGGGVVGDTVGFLAATYMRGVAFVQCPTTLLAMVDSAVGGKVGVDLPEGKNLVGAFWQPKFVWADVPVLQTLPEREWRTGLAEVIKYGVISDVEIIPKLEEADPRALKAKRALLEDLVVRSVSIKARIVSQDENDRRGLRELLNLGHTFGHAIEAVTRYGEYTHGEAISVGMCAAARLAGRLNGFSWGYVKRLEALLSRWGLPIRARRPLPRAKLLAAMARDKKSFGGKFRFVVPVKWGKAAVVSDVPPSALDQALKEVGL